MPPPIDPAQPQPQLSDLANPSKIPPAPPLNLSNPGNPPSQNKNFPMYMYPSHPPVQNTPPYPAINPPSRYPAPPAHTMTPSYMNYQYPPSHPHQKSNKLDDAEYPHYPTHQGGPYPNGNYASQPYPGPQAHHGDHQKQPSYQPINHYYPPSYQYPSQHLP